MKNLKLSPISTSSPLLAVARYALLSVLAAGWGAGALNAQPGTGPFAAFPTQSVKDGRFLGIACEGLSTMEENVQIMLAAPPSTTSFDLDVFDGDTGSLDGLGKNHWDLGTRQLKFSLYADPLRTGALAPADLIGEWYGNSANATSGTLWTSSTAAMPDNDWWNLHVTTSASAQAPSGNYLYVLMIDTDGACATGEQLESSLKIATSSPVSFRMPYFGLEGALLDIWNDGPIIYPGTFPPPGGFLSAPTTYDGTFEFFFTFPGGETELRLFDGDFDFGTDPSYPEGYPSGAPLVSCVDEDDLDTPADYSGFPFSTTGASPEGVQGPGIPADDNDLDAFRRGDPGDPNQLGCVHYQVTDPDGAVYFNNNPSGSLEWEQFVIATAASPFAKDADYVVGGTTLPGGVWKVKIIGLDLSNQNFWFADTCATRPERDPEPGEDPDDVPRVAACPDETVDLLGNFVWADEKNLGVLDPGEAGIPGVLMELVRLSDGVVVDTLRTGDTTDPNWGACEMNLTATDAKGLYCFGRNAPGRYEVRVAASNFEKGEPLAGRRLTTSNLSSKMPITGNVLNLDFGFAGARDRKK